MNLDRFFIYDVFFFGTARRIDSQSPVSNGGTLRWMAAGIEREREGNESRREKRMAVLVRIEGVAIEKCRRRASTIKRGFASRSAMLSDSNPR